MQEPGYGAAKTALQMCGLTKNKGGLDGAKWIFAYICRIFVIGQRLFAPRAYRAFKNGQPKESRREENAPANDDQR